MLLSFCFTKVIVPLLVLGDDHQLAERFFAAAFGGDFGVIFEMEVDDATFVGGEITEDNLLLKSNSFFDGGFGEMFEGVLAAFLVIVDIE